MELVGLPRPRTRQTSAAEDVSLSCTLADRGEDDARDPFLERFGVRLVGAEHELVETALGDEAGVPHAGSGELYLRVRHGGNLVRAQLAEMLAVAAVVRGEPEDPTRVRRDEPGVSIGLRPFSSGPGAGAP